MAICVGQWHVNQLSLAISGQVKVWSYIVEYVYDIALRPNRFNGLQELLLGAARYLVRHMSMLNT